MILVTGGAEFIGSNFVLQEIAAGRSVVNLDALTYAGNLHNLDAIRQQSGHTFVRGSITDVDLVEKLLADHKPTAMINLLPKAMSTAR